jgi:hypothetical protein
MEETAQNDEIQFKVLRSKFEVLSLKKDWKTAGSRRFGLRPD